MQLARSKVAPASCASKAPSSKSLDATCITAEEAQTTQRQTRERVPRPAGQVGAGARVAGSTNSDAGRVSTKARSAPDHNVAASTEPLPSCPRTTSRERYCDHCSAVVPSPANSAVTAEIAHNGADSRRKSDGNPASHLRTVPSIPRLR